MVSSHEQHHFANPADHQLDRQMERLVDQGVTTPYGAAAHVLDFDPHRDTTVTRDPRAEEAAQRRLRYSRRGGRSYPEPSDSELDPNWHVQPEPLNEQQALTNHVAAEIIRATLRSKHEADLKAAGVTDIAELHRLRAIERARDERRAR